MEQNKDSRETYVKESREIHLHRVKNFGYHWNDETADGHKLKYLIAVSIMCSGCRRFAGKRFRKGCSKVQEPVHLKEDARVLEFHFEPGV